MEVSVKCEARHIFIRLSGELDHHSAKGLLRRLDQEIEKTLPTQLTLDLSGVTFMDSSGIGVLAGRYRKISCFGGKVYVIHANRRIRKILEMSGIGDIVEMIDQEEKIEKQ